MKGRFVRRALIGASLLTPAMVHAQAGGFLVTLATDTISAERWTRTGNRVEGTAVAHSPFARVITWSMTLNADGTPATFEQSVVRADGTAIPNTPTVMKMTFTGDSLIRDVTLNGNATSRRSAAPKGTVPIIGGSWYHYQLGTQIAMRSGAKEVSAISFAAQQAVTQKIAVNFVGKDSAEVDYGGSPFGFRLDRNGNVLHGDGAKTTQKFIITPQPNIDVKAIAAAWGQKDAAGQAMGLPSPRDTMKATVGSAMVMVDYGRPGKRGRVIWGGIVPWGEVWRLGANQATQLVTDKDLEIGGQNIPAGKYTLWMLPAADKTMLIVNKQVGQWGTVYDAAQDLVRIPVEKRAGRSVAERFTVAMDGDELRFMWDNAGYGVKVRAK